MENGNLQPTNAPSIVAGVKKKKLIRAFHAPKPTGNSCSHQDDFHLCLRHASTILCDVQQRGDEPLPEVRMD